MNNLERVKSITANLRRALEKEGVTFSDRAYDDEKDIPARLLPLGRIVYSGESFEEASGARPLYAEAEYRIKVIFSGRDSSDAISEQQKWAHAVRTAVTVSALNSGTLAGTSYVNRVTLRKIEAEKNGDLSSIFCSASVRYREQ